MVRTTGIGCMRCANTESIEEWNEAPGRSSLFKTRIRLGTPYLGRMVKLRYVKYARKWLTCLPVQLLPNTFRLRLYSFHRIYKHHCAVDDPARAFDLHPKVRMSGSVDEIKRPVLPFDRNACRLDCNSSFTFSGKKVGSCAASIN
jgi:hypothetical protein